MIRFCEALPELSADCISVARILALDKAYAGSAVRNDFWIGEMNGEITCVLARSGGNLTVYNRGHAADELKNFVATLSPNEVFTETATAEKLGFNPIKQYTVLSKECGKTAQEAGPIGLLPLYEGLRLGADGDIDLPDFETFAVDVSHRLRHGAAVAVQDKTGAALGFLFDGGGIVNGIAVTPLSRGNGHGSRLLNRLTGRIGGRVFVCCTEENKPFYTKNGFNPCGNAAICRIGTTHERLF